MSSDFTKGSEAAAKAMVLIIATFTAGNILGYRDGCTRTRRIYETYRKGYSDGCKANAKTEE